MWGVGAFAMETSAKSNHGIDALFGLVARGPFLFCLFLNSACSCRSLAVRPLLCPVWVSDEVAIAGLVERRQRDMSREQAVARSGGPNGDSGRGGRGGNDTIKVCARSALGMLLWHMCSLCLWWCVEVGAGADRASSTRAKGACCGQVR